MFNLELEQLTLAGKTTDIKKKKKFVKFKNYINYIILNYASMTRIGGLSNFDYQRPKSVCKENRRELAKIINYD